MTELLKKLTQASGPSGDESEVRAVIRAEAEPFADEIIEDALGNLIVYRRAESAGNAAESAESKKKPLILAAHMDEVGLVATEHCGGGFYRFAFSGGVDARVALGKPVAFGTRRGVISPGKAWHLASAAEREAAPKADALYIDMFGDTAVQPGDYGTFVSEFREFGQGFVKAKALDDRFGCAVLLTLMQMRFDRDVYYAFTVQEEVGCRGAEVVANRLLSRAGDSTVIVVESTTAADYPSREGGEQVCKLGSGAVVPFMDGGTIYHRELWRQVTSIAEREGIAWQTKTRVAGGTDARSFQRGSVGSRVTAISLPTRNIHSPSCVGTVADMDCVLRLCRAAIAEV